MGTAPVWEDEGVLERDGGEGTTAAELYTQRCYCFTPLSCILKYKVKPANFMLYIFHHNLKKKVFIFHSRIIGVSLLIGPWLILRGMVTAFQWLLLLLASHFDASFIWQQDPHS